MVRLPGKFVWFEHFSKDVDQARRFYEALVDWHVMAVPTGIDFYHLAMVGKEGVGGFRQMPAGGRPGWVSYLSVSDVDSSFAAARDAGAKALLAPTTFPPMGRGACLFDPTGAVFSIWSAALGDRPDTSAPPAGDWCWNELVTPEPEAALAFYCTVFGFTSQTKPSAQGGNYYVLLADGVPRAGIRRSPDSAQAAHWLPYLAVASVDVMQERGEALGAKVLLPALDIPQVGRFAIMEDPCGAAVAVFTASAG